MANETTECPVCGEDVALADMIDDHPATGGDCCVSCAARTTLSRTDSEWLLKLAEKAAYLHPDDRERLRTIAGVLLANVPDDSEDPAWSELTQLQRMKFGSEREYLEHCVKWNADPNYRESNPYIA